MATVTEMTLQDLELEKKFNQLVSIAFGSKEKTGFLENFPVWKNGSGAKIKRWMITDQGRLLSTVAVRQCELKLDGEKVKMSLIGGVATDPEARGKGYATQLLESAIDYSRGQGAHLVALFGSEFGFYARLGFLPAGKQYRIPLSDFAMPQTQSQMSFEIREGYDPQVLELMILRGTGLAIEASCERWIPAHQNTRWICAWDAKRNLKAFAAIGRGIDLVGFIHDWAGEKAALDEIFSYLEIRQPNELQLLGPAYEYHRLKIPIGKALYDPLCLAKPLTDRGVDLLSRENIWLWGLDGA